MQQAKSAMETAITAAGGQVALARKIGVTQQSVSKWKRRGWCPEERAEQIAAAAGNAVAAAELAARPEVAE